LLKYIVIFQLVWITKKGQKNHKIRFRLKMFSLDLFDKEHSQQYEHEILFNSPQKSKYTKIVQKLLDTKNFKKIIKSKELFWSLFCFIQKSSHCCYRANNNDIFPHFKSNEGLHNIIEFIRMQLVEFLKLKTEFKFYYSGYDCSGQELSNNDKTKKIKCNYFFITYVFPCFEKLFKSMGYSYSCISTKEIVACKFYHTITLKNTLAECLRSLIQPLVIVNSYYEDLYNTFKKGEFADFTLSAIGGEIKINSYFLYSRSPGSIKLMVKGNFQESENKHIHFSEYNISTINLYIEFLYLGSKIMEKEYIQLLEKCDFMELINFAHVYEDKTFFDFCVNLFGYLSKMEQSKDLIEMSKYYKCERLMDIYEMLLLYQNLKSGDMC